jgi:hypothetical protein
MPGLLPETLDAGLKSRIEAMTKKVDDLGNDLRFSKGRAQWAAATVAQRNFRGVEIEVPGAKPGDTVSIGSTQNIPDGVFLTGTVNSAGKVRVTAINMTDTDLNLDAGTIHVDVRHR